MMQKIIFYALTLFIILSPIAGFAETKGIVSQGTDRPGGQETASAAGSALLAAGEYEKAIAALTAELALNPQRV